MNAEESDGTLVLNIGKLTGGTKLAVEYAKQYGKPFLVVQLDSAITTEATLSWLEANNIRVLNVAGTRESKYPELYARALDYLRMVFMSESTYQTEEEKTTTPTETPPPR